jgi:hypothetical protein
MAESRRVFLSRRRAAELADTGRRRFVSDRCLQSHLPASGAFGSDTKKITRNPMTPMFVPDAIEKADPTLPPGVLCS